MMTAMESDIGFEDRFVTVGGLTIRYIEEGAGPAVLMLHGASLGSSADVFRRNLKPLAAEGFRVIAFDYPGFGLSDFSADGSVPFKEQITCGLVNALGLEKVALIGHSQAGLIAVRMGLAHPDLVTHVIILGTGPLLPPLEGGTGTRSEQSQQRLERRMSRAEPTVEDTRKLLEANLYHHDLITDEELQLRHSRSIGRCFEAMVARTDAREKTRAASKQETGPESAPLYERMIDLTMPLLLIYGRDDRGRAGLRAEILKKQHPNLHLHIVDDCKHLVSWDAEDLFYRLAVSFLEQ